MESLELEGRLDALDEDVATGGSLDPLDDPAPDLALPDPAPIEPPAPDPPPADPGPPDPIVAAPAAAAEDAGTISAARILQDRPDVLKAYYEGYYRHGDPNSSAWTDRVGGDTPEAYATYWYNRYGKYEGYAQSDQTAADNISIERLLEERPDVFRAYYTEYYGPNNDRHSGAWAERVGGETLQDYAKYWYETYGKQEGYSQAPRAAAAPSDPEPAEPPQDSGPPPIPWPVEDPSLDPWNHPAIYGDDYPRPPGLDAPAPEPDLSPPEPEVDPVAPDGDPPADAMLDVGRSLMEADLFG